ncbi:unnamed protein product, partial [Nesidiocoris tenuis]
VWTDFEAAKLNDAHLPNKIKANFRSRNSFRPKTEDVPGVPRRPQILVRKLSSQTSKRI